MKLNFASLVLPESLFASRKARVLLAIHQQAENTNQVEIKRKSTVEYVGPTCIVCEIVDRSM